MILFFMLTSFLTDLCLTKPVEVHSVQVSPLDKTPLFVESKIHKQMFSKRLPNCETACSEHVTGIFQMLFAPGNMSTARNAICSRYHQVEECMLPLTHCIESWVPVVTSGIRYMCVDQKNAFNVLLDCIDMNSLIIKHECDLQCNPNSLVAGLALKDTVMQTLDQPFGNGAVNVKHLIEPHLGRIAFSESCRITQCLLNCYKSKFNMMCEGTAGSLIMEMISRPLSYEKEVPVSTQVLSAFFNGILPHSCSFLVDKKGMRIDVELDNEIKRMYFNRRQPSAEDFKFVGQPVQAQNPLYIVDRVFNRHVSPLEDRTLLVTSFSKDSLGQFEEEIPSEDEKLILSSGSYEHLSNALGLSSADLNDSLFSSGKGL